MKQMQRPAPDIPDDKKAKETDQRFLLQASPYAIKYPAKIRPNVSKIQYNNRSILFPFF